MAGEVKRWSEMSSQEITENSLFLHSDPDNTQDSGYYSHKSSAPEVFDKALRAFEFTQRLNTTSKTVFGAINEIAYKEVTGTLTAGNTSITLLDASITSSSTIDVYTDVYGISPTSITVSTGSVILTFEAQQTDMSVKVRVS